MYFYLNAAGWISLVSKNFKSINLMSMNFKLVKPMPMNFKSINFKLVVLFNALYSFLCLGNFIIKKELT